MLHPSRNNLKTKDASSIAQQLENQGCFIPRTTTWKPRMLHPSHNNLKTRDASCLAQQLENQGCFIPRTTTWKPRMLHPSHNNLKTTDALYPSRNNLKTKDALYPSRNNLKTKDASSLAQQLENQACFIPRATTWKPRMLHPSHNNLKTKDASSLAQQLENQGCFIPCTTTWKPRMLHPLHNNLKTKDASSLAQQLENQGCFIPRATTTWKSLLGWISCFFSYFHFVRSEVWAGGSFCSDLVFQGWFVSTKWRSRLHEGNVHPHPSTLKLSDFNPRNTTSGRRKPPCLIKMLLPCQVLSIAQLTAMVCLRGISACSNTLKHPFAETCTQHYNHKNALESDSLQLTLRCLMSGFAWHASVKTADSIATKLLCVCLMASFSWSLWSASWLFCNWAVMRCLGVIFVFDFDFPRKRSKKNLVFWEVWSCSNSVSLKFDSGNNWSVEALIWRNNI